MTNGIRNIGIFSHVDAGKTTITEQMLYLGGALNSPGDVNKGTTVSDHLKIEKARGVSIRAADLCFRWKGVSINLADTPGHADFSAEVERSLWIIDGAIMVVSSVDGLQAHTWALWDALRQRGIPVLFFFNKIDRPGADSKRVMTEIEKEFGIKTFPVTCPLHEGDDSTEIAGVFEKKELPQVQAWHRHSMENLSEADDEILEKYLEGDKLTSEYIFQKLKFHTRNLSIYPMLVGCAKYGRGITDLLDAVVNYLPDAGQNSGKLSALVYRISHEPTLGRLAYVRIFDGKIGIRDQIQNTSSGRTEKVAQIKKHLTGKLHEMSELKCGDSGILSGLPDAAVGDILGSDHRIPKNTTVTAAVMTVRIEPADDNDFTRLAHALETMNLEDPRLNFRWYVAEHELHLNLMGRIQMEIIQAGLIERFNVEAKFGKPTVIYKETPAASANGFSSYTMPKPCWAVVKFAIEPGARGSGIVYKSSVRFDKIKQKYQNEIEAAIPKALEQGIKGWEITDIKITLIDGEDHEIHSRPGDWNIAVPMAIMNGLTQTGTTLLEPVLLFVINAPEDLLGQIAGDLHKMRGTFESPVFEGGRVKISGKLPAATSMDYSIRLGTLSGGRAQIRFSFNGYEAVPDSEGVIRPYKGVNPLDRSRWILHNRGAFKAEERKM